MPNVLLSDAMGLVPNTVAVFPNKKILESINFTITILKTKPTLIYN